MEQTGNTEPVLAHVLFMDIVGCSKLPTDEQQRIVRRLQQLVRASAEYQRSLATEQVISLPTGDGMALAFFNKLDAAVLCAVEISRSIRAESLCSIRMGVNTGPVFVMEDINHKRNISGAGINRAERVMSVGEDRHVLLSESVAESLRHLSEWAPKIHEIGECQVKDGRIRVWNLVDGEIGNPATPKKSWRRLKRRRRLIVAAEASVVVAMVAVVAFAFWAGRSGKGLFSGEETPSIAVLPFEDMSPAKDQEYFSDGLSEELMNELSRIHGLRVAGRMSSFQFRGKAANSKEVGDKLNVSTLLEGSVRKQGARTRVAAHLIHASDGISLWSETFDRDIKDIFAVQEEIANALTGALKVKLLGQGKVPAGSKTNADAYNAFLQGRYFLERLYKINLEKAVSYFSQATILDPKYAPAWAGLGDAYSGQANSGYVDDSVKGFQLAREAVKTALDLDPNLGAAHAAQGWILEHGQEWDAADAAYKQALALEPGNAIVISHAGTLARVEGRFDDAVTLGRRATQIDPLHPGNYHNLGVSLYYAGRYEEATAAFRKTLELAPDSEITHCMLGRVALLMGRPEAALIEMEKEKHPAFRIFGLALAYHASGRNKESDASLGELLTKYPAANYQFAELYAFRGETDRAFERLDRCYESRGLTQLKGDPLLKNIMRDPRYAALLKKVGLAL